MVHTMKLSKNPKDYIFVVCKSFDDGWCAAITPEDFFSREGYMYDQHLPLNIPGWGCDMEGYYSCEADLSAREMHDDLISKGFAFSQDFAEFLADHGHGEIFIPGITEYLAPPKPSAVHPPAGVKLNTAVLKQFCADYFKNNPGVLVSEYDPEDAKEMRLYELEHYLSSPSVWKRVEKTKDGNTWHRAFWVKDFSKLESHGYCDEDAVKMYFWTDLTDSRIVSFSLECH